MSFRFKREGGSGEVKLKELGPIGGTAKISKVGKWDQRATEDQGSKGLIAGRGSEGDKGEEKNTLAEKVREEENEAVSKVEVKGDGKEWGN